ncbi:alpha-amylase [Gulosibacter macacae]|uniref:Alpha-amylase n=1 Tax=Gulosibacter macacae TaxID=2488791 RepID=A0A3P3W2U5_9MICO|nr:alpha-amylase family protein [Gulosibacter macacae]RRJ87153.1 alpha-amylase [Gulosibacter macacae]
MSLLDHAIWWQVYPLGACGAPIHDRDGADAGHRLRRLDAWLDYAIELGCSGLLLGPIFASSSHGYDTLDYFRIDARLGDDADFDEFMSQCRARGLSVMLDGVFNHVGSAHPLVAESQAQGGGLVQIRDGQPAPWEGHGDLALLDHRNPAVADLVVEVMLHWLRRGIAGWRLDVAYAVPPEFWREVLSRVRAEFPEALFLGEVIHGDYEAIVHEGTLDSVTQYELWKGIWSSIADSNFWELAWALERHQEFSEEFVPQTFVGNHDVTRIASEVGDAGAALAAAVLFTVPGMPSIYYGDEQGFQGEKGHGRDADAPLRPALPASPAELGADGWWLYRLYQQLIGLRRRNAWIARGKLEVLAKDNEWLEYVVRGEAHELHVRLELGDVPSAVVSVDGSQSFNWGASQ